jgi:hypothetical protein
MRRGALLLMVWSAGWAVALGQGGQGPAAPARPAGEGRTGAGPEAPAPPENLRTFDPQEVRLDWNNRRWQLVAGQTVLKDFGFREQEARQALRLIQELHLNQYGTVGTARPVLEYWLSDGHPPARLSSGVRTLPLDPGGLRLEQYQGQWCLCDAQRVLFAFGTDAEEARQALAVLRKYGFNEVGVLGQVTLSMMVFAHTSVDPAGTLPDRHMASPHIPNPQRPAPARLNLPKTPAPDPGLVTPAVAPLAVPNASPANRHQPAGFWREEPQIAGRPHPPATAPPPAAGAPQRVTFDWRRVDVRQENARWVLTAGGTPLANFGTDQYSARLALSAVRHYRFTEQWRLADGFTYFLSTGQAPRGLMLGLTAQEFRPDDLTVRQVDDRYALCEGPRAVIPLGANPDDARALLDVIRRNRFDRLCRLGAEGPGGLTFLVRSQ